VIQGFDLDIYMPANANNGYTLYDANGASLLSASTVPSGGVLLHLPVGFGIQFSGASATTLSFVIMAY
jgi:hypothetical protein